MLRLNRPAARNALTPGLIRAIGAAILEAESDGVLRAAVITGTGDRAFCAGMDLRAFASGEAAGAGDDDATRAYFRLIDGATDIPLIGELAKNMLGRTFCPLGDAAAMPTISIVEKFRQEFEDHLNGKPCPFAKHVELAVV